MSDRVPDILVEQLALGELPPDRAADVRRRLEAEPGGLMRLEALRESDAAVLIGHPPRAVAAMIERRAPSEPPRRSLLVPALAGAVAALVLVLVPWNQAPVQEGAPPAGLGQTNRVKGDPHVTVDRKVGERTEPLRSGARAAPGDRLQLGYVASGAAHGVLLSIDGRGAVTLHFPQDAAGPTALVGDGAQRLEFSYQLDDAPGFERFVLVTSAQPMDVAAVLAAARDVGADPERPLALAAGLRQKDLLLLKPGVTP